MFFLAFFSELKVEGSRIPSLPSPQKSKGSKKGSKQKYQQLYEIQKKGAYASSKHLLRRYLDPQNIPKTHPEEVFGCIGFDVFGSVLGLMSSIGSFRNWMMGPATRQLADK